MLSNPSVFGLNYFLVIFLLTLCEEAQSVKIRIIESLSDVTTPVPVFQCGLPCAGDNVINNNVFRSYLSI